MKEIEKRKVVDFATIFSAEYRVPDSLQTQTRPSPEEEILNSSLKITLDQSSKVHSLKPIAYCKRRSICCCLSLSLIAATL
jgi:hypothetical protein